jgi:hypothetical protein
MASAKMRGLKLKYEGLAISYKNCPPNPKKKRKPPPIKEISAPIMNTKNSLKSPTKNTAANIHDHTHYIALFASHNSFNIIYIIGKNYSIK